MVLPFNEPMRRSYLLSIGAAILITLAAFFLLRKPVIAPESLISFSPGATDTPVASASVSIGTQANIIVQSPTAHAVVSNPITVSGKARVFEGTFQYALRDPEGNVLFRAVGLASVPDSQGYRNFSVKIPLNVGTPRDLTIEVFEYSAKDGSIINLVQVPVRLGSADTSAIKVFLLNRRLNYNESCDAMLPVTRTVLKTREPAYIALYELLRGPVGTEKDDQYFTSIPDGVKINSIKISNGIAYADFNSTLEYQVGGSCRVASIRAQITNTLKQFAGVSNVVISVDGRVEDALQP